MFYMKRQKNKMLTRSRYIKAAEEMAVKSDA